LLTEGIGLDYVSRMARISRVVASGYPHHVTQRGVRSIPIFQADSDRRAYLDFMADELNRFGIEVLAWCLMTNHPPDRSSK
jgi:putative transposase